MDKKISYGQQFLQNLMRLRELAHFSQLCLPDFSFTYVYNVAVGKFDFPSMKFIGDMLPFVPPDRWFYLVGEQFDSAIDDDAAYTTDFRQSVNYRRILDIPKSAGSYKVWCKSKNLSYRSFMSIVNGNRQLTPQRIFSLRDMLPPLGWFVR